MGAVDAFQYLPEDPIARLLGLVLLVVFGYGGKGFIIALRKDRRDEDRDDIDLLELVRKMTAEELKKYRDELELEKAKVIELQKEMDHIRKDLTSMRIRESQLANAITANGGTVPEWPPYIHRPDHD